MKCRCPRCNFTYDLVTKEKVQRNAQQNAKYWVWMTLLGEDIGHSKEEMHYVFKRLFLGDKMPVLSNDEFMEYLKKLDHKEVSTVKLDVQEMKEYLDKVFQQAQECNINLPLEK